MKKSVTLILAAVMCFTMLSFAGFAADGYDYGIAVPRLAMTKRCLQSTATATDVTSTELYNGILTLSPSHAIYTIDENLNVLDEAGATIADIHTAIIHLNNLVIPAFRIETKTVAEAFVAFENKVTLSDAAVISSDPEIIKYIRQNTSYTVGIIDFSKKSFENGLTDEVLMEIRGTVNKNLAKTVVLPLSLTTRYTVKFLQKRLITVWTDARNCQTITQAAQIVTTGINGALLQNRNTFDDFLITCNEKSSSIRKSYLIGHRGNPGTYCENTVEGSMIAYKAGADAVENDIHLSKDGVLFVMHDSDISRMTNGTGNIEDMTYEELRSFTMNGTDNTPIPTLEEYFKAFKGLDLQLFVEIKGSQAELITELVRLIDEYDFLSQISIISFDGTQLHRLYEALPEISLGLLCGTNAGTVKQKIQNALSVTKEYNSTYNSSSSNLTYEVYNQLEYRGITVWPWTFGAWSSAVEEGLHGASGVTLDYVAQGAQFPNSVEIPAAETVFAGASYTPGTTITYRDGTALTGEEYLGTYDAGLAYIKILEGSEIAVLNEDNTSFTTTKAGTVTFVVAQRCAYVPSQGFLSKYYTIYSQPQTLTVTRLSGDINIDGHVTIEDAVLSFMALAGKTELSGEDLSAADINSNGALDLLDTMKLFMLVAGKA